MIKGSLNYLLGEVINVKTILMGSFVINDGFNDNEVFNGGHL